MRTSLKQTLEIAERTGWKVAKHIQFADNQHNYILTDKENSCFIVYWCKENWILDSQFYDYKYTEN